MSFADNRNKRQRSASTSSTSSSASTSSSLSTNSLSKYPHSKYHRSASPSTTSSSETFICNLPPTCNNLSNPPTAFKSLQELQRHQDSFHRWICYAPVRERGPVMNDVKGKGKMVEGDGMMPTTFSGRMNGKVFRECGKVFPEERLFQLHQIEVHDPITRERQARGDKIFQCFLPPEQCSKTFMTPTRRRQHLIAKHKYPQQYFFSITNHGLNKIAETDGLSTSLIRPRVIYPKALETGMAVDPLQSKTQSMLSSERNEEEVVKGNINGSRDNEIPEVEMDDLTEITGKMKGLGSSLEFVPRGVRKKQGFKGP